MAKTSSSFRDTQWYIGQIYTVRQKKGTTFLLWMNLSIHNVIWQNLVLLLLMNIIIDVKYLISGIYTAALYAKSMI